jgi:predicted amidophosphoribosyltransferase
VATEVICPVCNADVPLSGDEKKGEEVFCAVCSAPLKLGGDYGDESLDAEEDF